MNELGGAWRTYGEGKCTQGLVLKLERKTPLRKHRRRWEDNIKIVLQEVRRGYKLVRSGSSRDMLWALVKAEMNLRFL